jgi:hypothetical protein
MSPQESQARPEQARREQVRPEQPLLDGPSTHQHRLGLSVSQLVGSAVAAAAAAFGASYLGVAGTIIGAAVASVIATVASAMYTTSVHRTRQVVRTTVTQWTGTAAIAPVVDPGAPPAAPAPAERRPPWTRLALAAAAVLAVALGGITAVETLAGRPLASVVGGSTASGTTLGSADGSGGSTTRKPGTPVLAPDTTVTPTPTADPTPTSGPTPAAPTPPTGTPTASPTTAPTAEPPTPVPSPAPAGG